MIDIITCSRKDGDAKEMFNSFQTSWPCRLYEMVGYDSIAAGYNDALCSMSMADIVIFTHGDVRNMASSYAMQRAIKFLEAHVYSGFVGVAGTAHLHKSGVWWDKDTNTNVLKGSITHDAKKAVYKTVFGNGLVESPVVALDGVFLMATKSALQGFKFWSHRFHFYDIDACMQMHCNGRTNYVVDIPLLHYSIGGLDNTWMDARNKFLEKWSNKLPAVTI